MTRARKLLITLDCFLLYLPIVIGLGFLSFFIPKTLIPLYDQFHPDPPQRTYIDRGNSPPPGLDEFIADKDFVPDNVDAEITKRREEHLIFGLSYMAAGAIYFAIRTWAIWIKRSPSQPTTAP